MSSTKACGAGVGVDGNSKHSEVLSPAIATNESKLVRWSKSLVISVFAAAAAACVVITYKTAAAAERRQFEAKIRNHANEIVAISAVRNRYLLDSLDDVSDLISSYAIDQKLSWPFVSLPFFKQAMSPLLEESRGGINSGLITFVHDEDRKAFENYTLQDQRWVPEDQHPLQMIPFIWGLSPKGKPIPSPRAPGRRSDVLRQNEPVLPQFLNLDTRTLPSDANGDVDRMIDQRVSYASGFEYQGTGSGQNQQIVPVAFINSPVFEDIQRMGNVVAYTSLQIRASAFFENIIAGGKSSMDLFVYSSCDSGLTFRIDGPLVRFLDVGDAHDRRLNRFNFSIPSPIHDLTRCEHRFDIYPTGEFFDLESSTNKPFVYSAVVLAIFVVTSLTFLAYDKLVERRQLIVLTSAQQTGAVVDSYFPEQFRERLLEGALERSRSTAGGKSTNATLLKTKPIADLFPHVTVMFADICDFTAWSSARQPSQVFLLLEKIYSSFDAVAKKHNIFKVETIGDSYLAATGLPTPNEMHAETMAQFARNCRDKLIEAVDGLEIILGPDTGDLGMRFGLNSGPVTAGVLRGEKSRFQLFGDTVNTASRIEGAGERNRIHTSNETAEYLKKSGKEHWIIKRNESIQVKGKGTMQTFWLIDADVDNCREPGSTALVAVGRCSEDELLRASRKTERLVEWIVVVLQGQLQKIVAMRNSRTQAPTGSANEAAGLRFHGPVEATVLEEVQEIIQLSNTECTYKQDPATVDLGDAVVEQLRIFVTRIASMYHANSFHCFEHATHVTQSVTKLLARVVASDTNIDFRKMEYKQPERTVNSEMHQLTYGITSDPIIEFACSFSSIIHDCDHQGVANATLVKEGSELAMMYKYKSVAEQNSVDLAWGLLMEPMFADLRACIYQTQEELDRFRQLVVNSVMATDIVDKELGAARKARWAKAFALDGMEDDDVTDEKDIANRKATIVIEHIIQASDVSHTMQHWHIYTKWNERLFHELYKAHLEGRGTFDPSVGDSWYEGELTFFDFYIIPLAKKLADCGVFGVASDEYLSFARANRSEWERKGRNIVEGYMKRYKETDDSC